jgi:MFS family permease
MAIITIGEMIVYPTGQSSAASFASEDKRGRYMAVYGFQWMIPNMFGVLAAGIIMEQFGPNWVWYLAAILSLISTVGFWLLHGITKETSSKELDHINEELFEYTNPSIE